MLNKQNKINKFVGLIKQRESNKTTTNQIKIWTAVKGKGKATEKNNMQIRGSNEPRKRLT